MKRIVIYLLLACLIFSNISGIKGTEVSKDLPSSYTKNNASVDTGDNFSILFSMDGHIDEVDVDEKKFYGNERSGFYMSEWNNFPDLSGNIVANPGFEDIQNGSESSWNSYHNGYTISNESHNGNHSIMIKCWNDSMIYGAYQKITFNDTMKNYSLLKLSGWSKAENVSGKRDYHYSIYVDITYIDNTHLWGQVAMFDTGSHNWRYSEKIIHIGKPVKYLYIYALFRYHTGKVFFDDIKIAKTDYTWLNGSVTENNGTIYENLTKGDVMFNASYIPHDRYIRVNARVRALCNEDKAVTLYFSLPLNLSGYIWGDDVRNGRIINFSDENLYKNWQWFGRDRYISIYPISSISDNETGISYAIPLNNPVIFRIFYSPFSYTISFDFALTNKTKISSKEANISFIVYKNDYPKWGFRGALKKYYEIFPQYFTKRVIDEGIWMPFVDISTINESEDFGFAFHEGNNNVPWDDQHGIYSFVYTEPWFYWEDMGDYSDKPNVSQVMQRLYENINSSNLWLRMNSRAVIVSGAYNETGNYFFDIRNVPWISGSGWSALFVTNSDPDIGENKSYWNKAHVVWNLTIEPAFEDAMEENATLDGVYLDSLGGYFWYMNDYREKNFENITFPLSLDSKGNPVIVELFTHYKFTKNVSKNMHKNRKLVMANGMGIPASFFFPLIDVSGTEINWFQNGNFTPATDETLNFLRALSYKKPYLFLMNTNFSSMGYEDVERYFKKCLFYGFYPSMFSHNACNDVYWENSSLYNRDRPLFKKYIPLIKEINSDGWEPITYGISNNSNVYVERYGKYFTIHNPTNKSQKFSLRIYANKIGIKGFSIVELVENRSISYTGNETITINDSIPSNDTWILKFERKAYYVAPWGNDSNPGTISQPWKTIQHAVTEARAGDTVFIRDGIYHEHISSIYDGDADGYITFSAYSNDRIIIDGNGSSWSNCITITNSYIKLVGLEIRNWTTGMWITNSSHIQIYNCSVYNVTFGIGMADGTHDFELRNIELYNFLLYGFDASPSGGKDCYNGLIYKCIAHDAVDQGQNVDGFALGHGNQHNFTFNQCISYNVFDGFDISAKNTTLNRCLSHDCWYTGYKIWQDNITLVNCIAYHNGITNAELDWDGSPGKTTLQNCNFIDAGTYNIWIENSSDSLQMYNCILTNGDNIGLSFEERDASNYNGDYNIFHNDNPLRVISVGYTDEFSIDDIRDGAWTNYSSQDEHSIVVYDPPKLFMNLSNWDFHLSEESTAIDNGTSYNAPLVDFDGIERPQGNGYDIGAYEYAGIPYIPIDYIAITFSTKNEICNYNISTNFSFNAYASAFNNTYGFVGLINANWSIANYGSNASINATQGKRILFNSGNNDGIATLIAEHNGLNDTAIFTINSSLFSFMLHRGWNFVTLPCENEYNASMLYFSIQGCNLILKWNNSKDDFDVYTHGSPNNFAIENGTGYFISVSNNTNLSVTGLPITSVNITLLVGWNSLGWFKEEQTNASDIYNSIAGCNIVLRWNNSRNDFDVYVPNAPDFVIEQGNGFFVSVSQQSQWHG